MAEKKQTKKTPARGAAEKRGGKTGQGKVSPDKRPRRLRDEIWAIALIAVGAFLIVALQTGAAGQFGVAMKTLLKGCFGFMGYVLPYYMIVYGVLLFAKKAARLGGRSVFFLALIFLLLTAANASRFLSDDFDFGVSSLPSFFDKGVAGAGGGFFGDLIGMSLIKLFGKPGLYILCGAGILISLLLVVNTPISQMLDRFKERRDARKALAAAKAAERDTQDRDAPRTTSSGVDEAPASILSGEAGTALKQTRIVDYINSEYSDDLAEGTGIEPPSAPAPGMGLEAGDAFAAPAARGDGAAGDFELDSDFDSDSAADAGVGEQEAGADGSAARASEPDADVFASLSIFSGINSKNREQTSASSPAFSPAAHSPSAFSPDGARAGETGGAPLVPSAYELPHTGLLNSGPARRGNEGNVDPRRMAQKLEQTLRNFDVDAKVMQVTVGPAVTRYEIQPGVGVKVASIKRIENDIALNLEAKSLRIEAPIPGKAAVGIEVANDRIDVVVLRDILESREFKSSESKIGFAVGMDISGNSIVADLKSMPHMLIAGSTGSGKSVCINSIIMSLLFKARPDEVRLILIDPKVVELGNYNGIPHLLVPVVTESGKAAAALNWAVMEMNERYEKLGRERVRDLEAYNRLMRERGEPEAVLPQIVIIIDELADLMMEARAKVEEAICRIAQKARAAGMHLIVATQRPSVDVITGLIKSNIPSR
ncbi:MAG: DNA translocase FtsK, partial [Clostridiales Family XIII bacterium]|nr:DNA translocase FtsK [Clostridiales Family XIII bacterium]